MTKYRKLSSLKQQKYILPEFWTLDAENQHVGRAALLLKPVGDTRLFLPGVQWWPPVPRVLWLAAQSPQPLSVSSQGLVLSDGASRGISPSYKDTIYSGFQTILMTSYLLTSAKTYFLSF